MAVRSLRRVTLIKVFNYESFLLTVSNYNMALRADKEEDEPGLAGLQLYWQDSTKKPRMEYRRWQELFQMAVMGKYDIDVNDIIRDIETRQFLVSVWRAWSRVSVSTRLLVGFRSRSRSRLKSGVSN